MTNGMESSSDGGLSVDDMKREQLDRLSEMEKLRQDVSGLNDMYIDILQRVTNKLGLMATLADEIENGMRLCPEAMTEDMKAQFHVIHQTALMDRYMCTKALFQHTLGAIREATHFVSNMDDTIRIPNDTPPPVMDDQAQPGVLDESGRTISSDSDATIAARLDNSDIHLMDDDEGGPSTSRKGEKKSESKNTESKSEVNEGTIEKTDDKETSSAGTSAQKDTPMAPPTEGDHEKTDSHSTQDKRSEQKRKKKKKKRSKSADKRRRSKEAEKMEHHLNKHLKRSRDKESKKGSTSEKRVKKKIREEENEPVVEVPKVIELVTISDEELVEPSNTFVSSHAIPTASAVKEKEEMMEEEEFKENEEIGNELKAAFRQVDESASLLPRPTPSPQLILPSDDQSLGRGPGFTLANMIETPMKPADSEALTEGECELSPMDIESGESEVAMEKEEEKIVEKSKRTGKNDTQCGLKERLEEEIRLRESGRFSPKRRGRSRSISYSPIRRDRSRSRSRSPYRRGDWRRDRVRRYSTYRSRYDRWSRSPTRSRSRSRYRSPSRERRRSRSREGRRSRERRSRSREVERRDRDRERRRDRTPSRESIPKDKEACSPMPRAYAKSKKKKHKKEKKKEKEKKDEKEEEKKTEECVQEEVIVQVEEKVASPQPAAASSSSPSILVIPPISTLSPTPSSHSGSSSPSIFVPPSPIVLPSKPPALKISIPSTLPTRKGVSGRSSKSSSSTTLVLSSGGGKSISSTSIVTSATQSSSSTSLMGEKRKGRGKENGGGRIQSLSDMSLEGNTRSDESIRGAKTNEVDEIISLTPPLSNPSANQKMRPSRPSSHEYAESSNSSSPTPLLFSTPLSMGGNVPSSHMSNGSRLPTLSAPQSFYPNQYYSGVPQNPYGPPSAATHEQSYQQWNRFYFGSGGQTQNDGIGGVHHSSSHLNHPSSSHPPSLMNVMGVLPRGEAVASPSNTIDWGQAAREHANITHQQMTCLAVPQPPPPPNNQYITTPFGVSQNGRGNDRFRGGAGKGQGW